MNKLIQKLENWAEKNPNKMKLLNHISETYFYMMSLVFSLHIMQAGMKSEMNHIALLTILIVMLESLVYTILSYGLDLLFDKWKETKDKDKKENENG